MRRRGVVPFHLLHSGVAVAVPRAPMQKGICQQRQQAPGTHGRCAVPACPRMQAAQPWQVCGQAARTHARRAHPLLWVGCHGTMPRCWKAPALQADAGNCQSQMALQCNPEAQPLKAAPPTLAGKRGMAIPPESLQPGVMAATPWGCVPVPVDDIKLRCVPFAAAGCRPCRAAPSGGRSAVFIPVAARRATQSDRALLATIARVVGDKTVWKAPRQASWRGRTTQRATQMTASQAQATAARHGSCAAPSGTRKRKSQPTPSSSGKRFSAFVCSRVLRR